jgi:predicted protein tyrosine phosphatase
MRPQLLRRAGEPAAEGDDRVATNVALPEIIVAGRSEAGRLLTSSSRGSVRYIISIGDTLESLPDGYQEHAARKLRLVFDDVEALTRADAGRMPPSREDVERLIEFCRRVDGTTLVHCSAGVSRSGAAAYILGCVLLGPGRESEAMARVIQIKPSVFPNRRMIWLADAILARDGAMIAAFRESFGRMYVQDFVLDE